MRIAIVNLTSGSMSRGYRKYLENLLPLLQTQPGISELIVFVPPQMEGCFKLDYTTFLSWPNGDHKWGFPWTKEQLRKKKPDVVFIPTAHLVNLGSIPTVVMVRNMEPLIVPFGGNPLIEAIKNIGRVFSARKAVHNADRIIAVSEHVKEFLITQWKINSDRIGVVYHGAELSCGTNFSQIPDALKSLQDERFIFTAGSIRPARGLEDLLMAFAKIHINTSNVKLLIAGAVDKVMVAHKARLDDLITKLGIAPGVLWAGSISEEEMSWCYHNCCVFVMTSRAEACPNVALEAMAHGCLCVSTETLPMPELFKDAALYYPPKDWRTLGGVIENVLSWPEDQRKKVSELAKQRASEFSWALCAEKTVEELKKTINPDQKY